MKKVVTANYRNRGEIKTRYLDADMNTPQVRNFEQGVALDRSKSASFRNRRYEVIGGKKFLVIS